MVKLKTLTDIARYRGLDGKFYGSYLAGSLINIPEDEAVWLEKARMAERVSKRRGGGWHGERRRHSEAARGRRGRLSKENMIDWMKTHHYMTITTKKELMGLSYKKIKELYNKAINLEGDST